MCLQQHIFDGCCLRKYKGLVSHVSSKMPFAKSLSSYQLTYQLLLALRLHLHFSSEAQGNVSCQESQPTILHAQEDKGQKSRP